MHIDQEATMSEDNPLRQDIQALEERVGRLERQAMGYGEPFQIQTLADKLTERIEREQIDLKSQVAGQLEYSILIRGSGGTWAMSESETLEKFLSYSSESLARSIAGLAHPVRIELFKALLTGPKESSVLMEIAGLNTTGQLYHHLTAMADVGLVERRSRNLWSAQNLGAFALLITSGHMLSEWRGGDES
jgi:hypothetical protein